MFLDRVKYRVGEKLTKPAREQAEIPPPDEPSDDGAFCASNTIDDDVAAIDTIMTTPGSDKNDAYCHGPPPVTSTNLVHDFMGRPAIDPLVDHSFARNPRATLARDPSDYLEALQTDAIQSGIREALQRPPSAIINDANVSRLRVTRSDLGSLDGLNWLNDVIMNAYLNLIVNRNRENPRLPRVYAFNTFLLLWYSRSYEDVRRWTRSVDIFAFDILLVPVHSHEHWTMMVVDVRSKLIHYMDSMSGAEEGHMRTLLNYLAEEHKDKKKRDLGVHKWRTINVEGLPKQQNGSDCGVFALKFAAFAAQGLEIDFTQREMPHFFRYPC